jgi:hypothetical protein
MVLSCYRITAREPSSFSVTSGWRPTYWDGRAGSSNWTPRPIRSVPTVSSVGSRERPGAEMLEDVRQLGHRPEAIAEHLDLV